MFGSLAGADGDARQEALAAIEDGLAAPGLTSRLGGAVAVDHDIDTQVARDIGRAERLSMPLLLVLLLVVFGALAAAGMPLVVGGLAILGAFTALRLLTMVTDVSVFAINLVTMLGLGLAIDYALFVVSRFREELAARPAGRQGVEDALVRTVATAGRTVAFSGVTVAISLAGLLWFPQMFLRSMGVGGIAAAMVAALTVLPALLAVLGPRINALSIPWLRRRPGRAAHGASGWWSRVAHSVMRRPLAYVAVIALALVALGLPFRNVAFGGIDARALPAATESRQVSQTLDRDFTRNATTAIAVVVSGAGAADLRGYAQRLRQVPGVTAAQITQTAAATSLITVRYDADPISSRARQVVVDVRAVDPPAGSSVAGGLQRTGAIITSAALLLVVVIGAFATSGITFIKLIGVGMIIAILLDATVVRALLVPATMRLLGRYNWWAPPPLARLWERYGHREHGAPPAPAGAAVRPSTARPG
ncbi:MAG TPA: MMPL family transporter [Actinomycetes bacterium]|nr:MMPL family transporter [Actinomycetes bacterium]